MPNEILSKDLTAVVWAHSTYSPPAGLPARTHQINLTSLADAAARQGAKADLGATRAMLYLVAVAMELAVAPTSGEIIEIYFGGSLSSTAGNGNPGGLSGSDAAYTGTSGDSLADSVLQLKHAGPLVCTADATGTVQYQEVGIYAPQMRYVMPVVKNESGQALHSDAVEMYVALIPITPEIQ